VAWARALAEYRGRNQEWAARAVQESISTPAGQALREHVIDFLADDPNELLDRLDGRTISLPGRTVILHTKGAAVERLDMSWPERLLDVLANPTLAYLLLLLGFYGLLFEITHPGVWAPGILGLICLALAFFAFQMLPINYAGLALLGLGLLLVVLEVKVHSLGLLTVAGLACLLLGSSMLIEPVPGIERVSWLVIVPVSAATALVMLFLVGNVVRAHRAPIQTGMEGLIGTEGIVRSDLDGQPGFVFVHGELWRACANEPLRAGQRVRIQGCDGLTLHVQRIVAGEEVEESKREMGSGG
jgi:membrane-bound serine protease (ClpP class)